MLNRIALFLSGTKGGFEIYVNTIKDIEGLTAEEKDELSAVVDRFPFRTTEYYLSLIDWSDPLDPLRMIAIPSIPELAGWGSLDPSGESDYTVAPGLEHKYEQTAVLLASGTCASLCRYCFRKRLFMDEHDEAPLNIDAALEYIAARPEISNVLVTGGDPFMMGTSKLDRLLESLREIEHVRIIRLGTKVPAVHPHRILEDPELMEVISKHITPDRSIYVMTQFNHPRELTEQSTTAVDMLQKANAVVSNQTPLLRKVNANPHTLAELMNELSYIGVAPYYVFQCRPTVGNRHFSVPIEESYRIVEEAKGMCSGLAKRFSYVMSHRSGKIEVIAVDEQNVYMRYHQAAKLEDMGKTIVLPRNPNALWLDDYMSE